MKNLYFLSFLLVIFFFNCSNEEKKPQLTQEQEAAKWKTFQQDFQSAVNKNDINKVVELTAFPLKGNFFTGSPDGLSRPNLIKNYDRIFGNGVRERVSKTQTKEWKNGKVEGKLDAERLGVPVGTSVVTLSLLYVEDEGTDYQTESSQIFYFANIDNEFKWVALFMAG